jgi:3-oxoacyl-[acyl-carrier protein] reductase
MTVTAPATVEVPGSVRDLTGRVALVTGSSRGIGRAIALHLAQRGAAVAVHGRDDAAVASVVAEVESAGGRALATTADLVHYEEIEALRARIAERLGAVDILVANAGGSTVPPGLLEDIPEASWRASVDANLTATFLTVKAFLPEMKRRSRGVIITMSSAAARRPTDRSPVAYAAAKAGIELLTKELALQAGPHGVRINCIAPETILTERNLEQIPAPVQEQLRSTHPIRRLGTPEDVAEAAGFLASDSSAWITGVTVDVAGGSVLV